MTFAQLEADGTLTTDGELPGTGFGEIDRSTLVEDLSPSARRLRRRAGVVRHGGGRDRRGGSATVATGVRYPRERVDVPPLVDGGTQGPTIAAYQTVQIACKLQGFRVADGNTWWYRIAQSPWNNQYYVSADAFYNNGRTSGSLSGTPFVDPNVGDC